MGKRLFLLLFSSLVGLLFNFDYLAADDYIDILQPDFNAVETVIEEKENTLSETRIYKAQSETNVTQEVKTPATGQNIISGNYISFLGKTISIIDVPDTTVDSADHVNKFGDKFLYGHNSNTVFKNLINLSGGSTFTIQYNGAINTYQVTRVVIFEKNVENGKLQLNGTGNFMRQVSNAKFEGINYDLSIMTCHGVSYGNGDASHRLVIFANRI